MTVGIVLVHGGGLDRRCWDLLLPQLATPAVAVDLPGRGDRPADLRAVTFAACAEAVASSVRAAGFEEVVLVGHSLAGCSMPSTIARLGSSVRRAVLVGATVPPDGAACVDTLDPDLQALVRRGTGEPAVMDEATARLMLGDDLGEERFAWCVERLVPEAPGLILEPVDLAPLLAPAVQRTWIRTLRDIVVPAGKQAAFAAQLEPCDVVDLDAGHMCMVSRPAELAAILDGLAGVSPGA